MSTVWLRDILIVTAGIIISSQGAPFASDSVAKMHNTQAQNTDLLQPPIKVDLLPRRLEKTTGPDVVSESTPQLRELPSQAFVKTVLRGFFDDLKKRPDLVDDLIRHEMSKELFQEPLTIVETVQLEPQTDVLSMSKAQPQVRPLVAPVLTLMPVLFNPGRKVEENQTQGAYYVSPQDSWSAPVLANTKAEPDVLNIFENKEPKQKLPTSARTKNLQTQSQPYDVSQDLGRTIKIDDPSPKKTMAPIRQQEETHYIYSIVPVSGEPEPKLDRLESEEDSSSTGGGCDGSSDVVNDASASNTIYDESPAYYYYVYYDDDDATEDKKYPALQEYPMPVSPETANNLHVPLLKGETIQPNFVQIEEAKAIDTLNTETSRGQVPHDIADDVAPQKMTSESEEEMDKSKMETVPRKNVKQKIEEKENASILEDDLKNFNH